jgi:probable HAF family extracellular repeat protein
VAGISYDFGVDPFVSSTVCWYKGKILQLPALDKAINSNPTSVNDWGQIVGVSGSRAVLWSIFPKASVIDLGTLGGEVSGANTINNRGQIVGQAQTVGGDLHPALWDRGGITDLGNFGDDPFGCAFTINDCGQIVGFSGADLSDVTTAHALLWETGRMINLQTQIPANSGWVLQQAVGINDQGQINGFGLHNGKIRAFLLTPINEPHH